MASTKVADFFAALGIRVDKRGFIAANNSFGDLNSKIKTFLGAVGVLAAGRAIGGAVNEVTELGDSIGKLSKGLGISTDALQTFRFAGERSGVSANLLDTALSKLPRKIADAAAGSQQAQQTFRDLGLSAAELARLAPEEQFLQIAEGFRRMEDPSKRTTAALRLFEETGARFIPLLREGRRGIEAYGKELTDLGGRLDKDAIEQSESWQDTLTNLDRVMLGLKVTLVRDLLPILQRAVAAFMEGRRTISRWAADGTLAQIAQQAKQLGLILGIFLLPILAPIIASFVAWAATVLLPAAAIGALILVIEDLIVWIAGGDSVMKDFINTLHSADADDWAGIEFLRFLFGGIGEAIADAVFWVQEFIGDVKEFLNLGFTEQLAKIGNFITDIGKSTLDAVVDFGSSAASALGIGPSPAAAAAGAGGVGAVNITAPIQIETNATNPAQIEGAVLRGIQTAAAEAKSQLTESR